MKVRKSSIEDINLILDIYAKARAFMKENGNPNQWYDYKPLKEDILEDISHRHHHVIFDDNKIYGCFTFFKGEDPTYKIIDDGTWLNDKKYGVIHKVASSFDKKGVFKAILNYCENEADNLRIDTHKDNHVMQNVLEKNGFKKCGIIYLHNGDERLAYQKIVRN